jgi:chromosome segregation ATPase
MSDSDDGNARVARLEKRVRKLEKGLKSLEALVNAKFALIAAPADETARLSHAIRCLKYEVRLLKQRPQAPAAPSAACAADLRDLREEVEWLKATQVTAADADGDRQFEIRRLSDDLEELRQAAERVEPRLLELREEVAAVGRTALATKRAVDAGGGGAGEEAVEQLAREVQSLKENYQASRQVFVDIPAVAAVQLVFRES